MVCTSMDLMSAFFNGYLEEEVYVRQPMGYEVDGQEHKFYILKKSLYGLKQTPRVWYNKIDEYLNGEGFGRSPSEPKLYTKVLLMIERAHLDMCSVLDHDH